MYIYSEVEGRDRLVKVDKQDKLVQLASQLGMYICSIIIIECHDYLYMMSCLNQLFCRCNTRSTRDSYRQTLANSLHDFTQFYNH